MCRVDIRALPARSCEAGYRYAADGGRVTRIVVPSPPLGRERCVELRRALGEAVEHRLAAFAAPPSSAIPARRPLGSASAPTRWSAGRGARPGRATRARSGRGPTARSRRAGRPPRGRLERDAAPPRDTLGELADRGSEPVLVQRSGSSPLTISRRSTLASRATSSARSTIAARRSRHPLASARWAASSIWAIAARC